MELKYLGRILGPQWPLLRRCLMTVVEPQAQLGRNGLTAPLLIHYIHCPERVWDVFSEKTQPPHFLPSALKIHISLSQCPGSSPVFLPVVGLFLPSLSIPLCGCSPPFGCNPTALSLLEGILCVNKCAFADSSVPVGWAECTARRTEGDFNTRLR